MKDKKEQHIDELLLDVLSGVADEDQIKQFRNWLEEDKKNVEYYHQIKAVWIASTQDKNPHNFNPSLSWLKINERIRKKRFLFGRFLKYAAVVAISLITGVLSTYFFFKGQPQSLSHSELVTTMNVIEAPYGARSKVSLTDGSMVWLNSGSKLHYPNEFTAEQREVKLEGEGYFIIKSNPAQPFIVNTESVSVKATGTSFNVKAYPDEAYIEATLVEGVISVQNEETPDAPFVLKPNQKLKIFKAQNQEIEIEKQELLKDKNTKKLTEGIIVETNINSEVEVSWKDAYWIIEDENLRSLEKKLERRYNISISVEDPLIYNFRYTGKLKDESVDEVLEVLALTSPLTYSKDGNKITLSVNRDFERKIRDLWKTD